jgi:hypothetical protein
MKKTLFLSSIILIFAFQVKAQNDVENVIVTDSTLVMGVVSEDYTSICNDVSTYCSCYSKDLDKGTIVIVSGIKTCNLSYSGSEYFFEIFYKNKAYYIKKDNLQFSKDINYFSEISKLSEEQATTFKSNAQYSATIAHNQTLNEALSFLETCKTKGLAILHWNIYDESEYTDGTSFKIEFYNPTKKTIKYITTTIVGYNPVGDRVYNSRKQSYNCQVKSVGPIEPEASGSYSFDYVWFTDMVETAKIISIVVQYMDGTTKTLTNPESIRLRRNLYRYLQDE